MWTSSAEASKAAFSKTLRNIARQQSETQLGANWLNNLTTLFVSWDLLEKLIYDAIPQNVVLFREPGLTVLAAPWAYALSGKASRMSGADGRSYDCQDAVGYLHEHILSNGIQAVSASEVEDWGRKYGREMTTDALEEINSKYKETYGYDGMTF